MLSSVEKFPSDVFLKAKSSRNKLKKSEDIFEMLLLRVP